ncbi:Melanoma-associated antigen 11, partial [Heterocephalus glaber]
QDNKIAKLLPILLLKYQRKEVITKTEMLRSVEHRYRQNFPQIFKAVCECMGLAFGIDMRELEPGSKIYVLMPVLGLTYSGLLAEDYQSISKINLLLVVLIVIFLKGNRASEEDVREFLRTREMLPQRKHFVIGDPWKFITKDLVQLQYLEYRQVPNSDPAHYEFLWGPRAKAETSKMKVLEHLAKVNRRDPRQDPEGSSTSQDVNFTQIRHHVFRNDKLDNLMRFLLGKYQKKELITMKEMLYTVDHDYHEHFLLIFRKLCVCICPGFGIEMKEVDPPGHTYELLPVLGLTYKGILDDDVQIIPKIDLLIFILSVIFIKGNRVSEEDLRELLRDRKLLAERELIIIGDPWKFITEDLVREEYLVYQQVPNSDPACYEFLWGPRTHAETSKMKILEHVAKLERASPRSYPHLYVEALREE